MDLFLFFDQFKAFYGLEVSANNEYNKRKVITDVINNALTKNNQ